MEGIGYEKLRNTALCNVEQKNRTDEQPAEMGCNSALYSVGPGFKHRPDQVSCFFSPKQQSIYILYYIILYYIILYYIILYYIILYYIILYYIILYYIILYYPNNIYATSRSTEKSRGTLQEIHFIKFIIRH